MVQWEVLNRICHCLLWILDLNSTNIIEYMYTYTLHLTYCCCLRCTKNDSWLVTKVTRSISAWPISPHRNRRNWVCFNMFQYGCFKNSAGPTQTCAVNQWNITSFWWLGLPHSESCQSTCRFRRSWNILPAWHRYNYAIWRHLPRAYFEQFNTLVTLKETVMKMNNYQTIKHMVHSSYYLIRIYRYIRYHIAYFLLNVSKDWGQFVRFCMSTCLGFTPSVWLRRFCGGWRLLCRHLGQSNWCSIMVQGVIGKFWGPLWDGGPH